MLEKIRYDRRLESLLSVLRCGSYAGAARELSLTPSAVSQQMRALERELGTKLFTTVKNVPVPTKACLEAAEYIRRLESARRQITGEAQGADSGQERLRVGITPSAESFVLSGVLAAITAARPTMQLRVSTGVAEELFRMLEARELDMAVVEGAGSPEGLCEVILDTDCLCVAVPPDSVFAKRGFIRLSELKKEPLILKPRDSGTGRLFHSGLISAGVPESSLHVMMEVESVDTIVRLVAGGYGVSVLSEKACAAYAAAGKIAAVRPEGMNLCRSVRILYRPGNAPLQELIGAIQKTYHSTATEPCAESPSDGEYPSPVLRDEVCHRTAERRESCEKQ